MKTMQKGFTLIELMIVVAIIGILASVAIPAYRQYITNAEASSAMRMVQGYVTKALACNQTGLGCGSALVEEAATALVDINKGGTNAPAQYEEITISFKNKTCGVSATITTTGLVFFGATGVMANAAATDIAQCEDGSGVSKMTNKTDYVDSTLNP
jgi:type IV pilus assembly protein PilA